ncbi:hypothetical protein SERLA73DRAFT_149006 [Serpula lacrymans var. lacrymans S7.3]|uniref:Uncharacterized protein n=2 Tax=Serpula lacrymans var. lacrymans TaxID=341189 RepID=F8PHK8_SERL3|nr:uncharacterized protein SERLADRAFT_404595 [Serpula lacrymans var. lacrymans S7.9]EGO04540.1 hypothetical protein SERLA73DRAFT_149006 [Serpula lacrymans var. lacrymans S7.3]EGO30420.1 hypothetical protein SERLADRAFT_404595 [Serpula lacrymans var. lacrymans S7.9]
MCKPCGQISVWLPVADILWNRMVIKVQLALHNKGVKLPGIGAIKSVCLSNLSMCGTGVRVMSGGSRKQAQQKRPLENPERGSGCEENWEGSGNPWGYKVEGSWKLIVPLGVTSRKTVDFSVTL